MPIVNIAGNKMSDVLGMTPEQYKEMSKELSARLNGVDKMSEIALELSKVVKEEKYDLETVMPMALVIGRYIETRESPIASLLRMGYAEGRQ